VRLLLVALGVLGPLLAAEEPAAFQVVVHPSVKGQNISRTVLADIFLKKVERWGDGMAIVAVDLTSTSPVREAFSRDVLGMPTVGVRTYWLREMGKGGVPPPTKHSDEEVIDFVASRRGAIGYVGPDTPLPSTVRAVKIQ